MAFRGIRDESQMFTPAFERAVSEFSYVANEQQKVSLPYPHNKGGHGEVSLSPEQKERLAISLRKS